MNSRSRLQRFWLLGACFAIVALLYVWLRPFLSLDKLLAQEASLLQLRQQHPVAVVFAGFLAYTAISFVPGTTGKSVIWGWYFGFWLGIVQVNLALTLTALVEFLIGRYAFRETIQGRFGLYTRQMNAALERDGAKYVLWLRILHAPFTFINYAFGATEIRLRTFWWSTQMGILPSNVVFVYAGAHLPTLEEFSRHGIHAFLSWELLAALVLLSVLPLVVGYFVPHGKRPTPPQPKPS